MSSAGSTVLENGSGRRILSIWVAPIAVLVGLWLWLAFSSGGYIAHQWLPPSLALGLFGLVVSLLVAYPRRPRQFSLALLSLFALYSVWVALSALWADSTNRVWMESGRTFTYLLVFALALIYFTDPAARRAFRYLIMAGALILLIACIVRLWSSASIVGLFIENRLSYPVSYPNNAGALFLVAFWPLLWLASGTEERAPVRGVALGLATGLLGLAIMTQSRGAIWSLAISLVIMFVISPARIRLLLYLLVPSLLMVYEFPNLNRYWLEGPQAVGGGPAARTLVVASITAAFIGMILSLLERWIRVSRRMKAIFGTIVLLGVLAAAIYGSITLTSDIGGPFKWVSQTWRQFTGQTQQEPPPQGESRFTLVFSSGRVDIWKVAWQEFQGAPLLGVGADNFVFQYDRLRTTDAYKPQQAHSLELQVLGETGVVGGLFAFGATLLALVGLLWPRFSAGWRATRESWLRRRQSDSSQAGEIAETVAASKNTEDPGPSLASTSLCDPRWGIEPRAYGWEMALVAGAGYWLIHASVDWLWQMAGVSIPALLFVAAGAASVDARAGVMWPRIARWLHIGAPATSVAAPLEEARSAPDQPGVLVDLDATSTDLDSSSDVLMTAPRRTDQRAVRATRRERNPVQRKHSVERLQPPGLLSHATRALLVAGAVLVLVVSGLPYLSLQFQDSASALAKTDGLQAIKRAEAARWLLPSDPRPHLTQASIYTGAARRALESGAPDRAGAVLDNLALAIVGYTRAIEVEPADWNLPYKAGVATANLLVAKGYTEGRLSGLDYEDLALSIVGLQDWSGLLSLEQKAPGPGAAAGSLVQGEAARADVAYYRDLSTKELADLALGFLQAAEERNPLATQIGAARETIEGIGLVVE